ncbi:BON domain-containing protein [Ensifer canadensis]
MFGLTFASQPTFQPIDIAGVMAVKAAMAYADGLTEADISVTRELGVIYLDGMVSTVQMLDEAQKIAAEVTSSPVRSRLRVAQ